MKISERRRLPRSNLAVPVFGLGGAPLGGLYRAMSNADAAALLGVAWQRGVRLFDTAPYYGYTRAERRLAAALAGWPRAELVLGSKVGRCLEPDPTVRSGDDGWVDPLPFRPRFDYSRDGLLRAFDASLERLGVERLDLLFVHDIGRLTHGDAEAGHWQQLTQGGGFRALEELRRDGRVGAVGLGVNEWQVAAASLQVFDVDCTMLAGRYTLLEQTSLAFLDACVAAGSRVIVAGPFNSGVLAGGTTFNYAPAPPEVLARAAALGAVCREFGVALPAAALQFPLAHPAVVACVAGAHGVAELAQNIAAFEAAIPPELWAALGQRGLIDERAPRPAG